MPTHDARVAARPVDLPVIVSSQRIDQNQLELCFAVRRSRALPETEAVFFCSSGNASAAASISARLLTTFGNQHFCGHWTRTMRHKPAIFASRFIRSPCKASAQWQVASDKWQDHAGVTESLAVAEQPLQRWTPKSFDSFTSAHFDLSVCPSMSLSSPRLHSRAGRWIKRNHFTRKRAFREGSGSVDLPSGCAKVSYRCAKRWLLVCRKSCDAGWKKWPRPKAWRAANTSAVRSRPISSDGRFAQLGASSSRKRARWVSILTKTCSKSSRESRLRHERPLRSICG